MSTNKAIKRQNRNKTNTNNHYVTCPCLGFGVPQHSQTGNMLLIQNFVVCANSKEFSRIFVCLMFVSSSSFLWTLVFQQVKLSLKRLQKLIPLSLIKIMIARSSQNSLLGNSTGKWTTSAKNNNSNVPCIILCSPAPHICTTQFNHTQPTSRKNPITLQGINVKSIGCMLIQNIDLTFRGTATVMGHAERRQRWEFLSPSVMQPSRWVAGFKWKNQWHVTSSILFQKWHRYETPRTFLSSWVRQRWR